MSLKTAQILNANTNVNNTTTPVSNPSSNATQPAQPVETTASTPSNPSTPSNSSNPSTPSTPSTYVWDPVAARDAILAKREEGIITLTPNADGTAYEVSGDTKKVRGYLKGLNARWNPETTNWLLPALAITDPTAASNERNAIVADRQAKRAEREATRTDKLEPKKSESKKPTSKKSSSKPASKPTSSKQPSPATKTYTAAEVQALIAKAVKAAFGMVAASAKNDEAITRLAAKVMTA